jgi:hypothetical protein
MLAGSSVGSEAVACSLAPISLLEQFSKHAQVFHGRVRGKSSRKGAPEHTYDVLVEEAFKGLPRDAKPALSLAVTFAIGAQCGFEAPKKDARVLVFMNEGDIVDSTSGSGFIWQEILQPEPHLNPRMDQLILLRQFVNPHPPYGVVPDEATAIHIALKTLLPIVDREALQAQWPLTVLKPPAERGSYDGVDWRVRGTLRCKAGRPGCPKEPLGVDGNQWTGDVARVQLGD